MTPVFLENVSTYAPRFSRGPRRIASFDEDGLTMAVAAAETCIPTPLLFLAGSHFPYRDGPTAAIAVAALRLPSETPTALFSGGPRAALDAFVAACGMGGGTVASAEADGAAAARVGPKPGIAAIRTISTISNPLDARWSCGSEVGSEDARFASNEIVRTVLEAARGGAPTLLALAGADDRAARSVAEALHCRVAAAGVADPLLILARALEGTRPGDLLLWAGYGGGATAVLLEILQPTPARPPRPPVPIDEATEARIREFHDDSAFTSGILLHRDRALYLGLQGRRCAACDRVWTLPITTCPKCGSEDRLEIRPLSRRGTIFTFTHEYYVPTPTPPVTMAVVDLDEGGRILVQVADATPEEGKVGARVRLMFRKLHSGGGFPNYYWKAVPE